MFTQRFFFDFDSPVRSAISSSSGLPSPSQWQLSIIADTKASTAMHDNENKTPPAARTAIAVTRWKVGDDKIVTNMLAEEVESKMRLSKSGLGD